ncbi:leucyl aminopeptidase [Alcanivorax hongdengensis A-11-3]|uniref:Probable cytosol aminopeptidase n=1 Tax=Alcanivorax hongdengensis A-11-3 TaxID=1177179 RepID=L0WAX4_9GAMM|nr:leucyl aminopeptidase [Alcanivorax hongdengensis]EKF74121.1 leucyl aminopeptidase [Alcanivorax hongdengensis A-11-3]
MDYAASHKALDKIKADALVLVVASNADLPASLPQATRDQLAAFIKAGDFSGKKGQQVWLHQPDGVDGKRLLLVGSGDKALDNRGWLQLLGKTIKTLTQSPVKQAVWLLDDQLDASLEWQVREGTRVAEENTYRFDEYRSKPAPAAKLTKLTFWHDQRNPALSQAIKTGKAIGAGVNLARDLGNRPPNDCYPAYLTGLARDLGKEYDKLTVKVVTEAQAEKMGMGAFCAVARGSEKDGQLIIMEYKGAKPGKQGPVALVGKGITFDTGGISLKPGASMDEMKYDMGGAASVFGSVKTVCELDLPLHMVAVVAAAENMPDGSAARPGDIVKTLSGQTVEILNTDAEGRLVLCDALTYVQQKHKPHTVIDIATLTGACVVALGAHAQAVYANDDDLSQALLAAGQETGDRGWPMPLWDDYQSQLDSPFADMQNIGGPKAGSITAACFLHRFARDVKWAHLDIAGTAWISGGMSKGATGRPVPMLTRYLMNLAGK